MDHAEWVVSMAHGAEVFHLTHGTEEGWYCSLSGKPGGAPVSVAATAESPQGAMDAALEKWLGPLDPDQP